MKKIGVSIYPDFDDLKTISNQLERIVELGYSDVFTSIQLADLGFENTTFEIADKYQYLYDFCFHNNIDIHVDINDRMLQRIGASFDDLKAVQNIHISHLRIDGGFTSEQIAIMTNNPYGIVIEDNASYFKPAKQHLETVLEKGNPKNFAASFNFFPLNDTGLSMDTIINNSQIYKQHHIPVGMFIGSLYSSKDLNQVGRGIVTCEEHRYKPSHIQAMECFANIEADFVIFGDSHPSLKELENVARIAKNDDWNYLLTKYTENLFYSNFDTKHCYVIEIPVWLDKNLDEEVRENLTTILFQARLDTPQNVLRTDNTRMICAMDPYLPIERSAYSICIHNDKANRYNGELHIPFVDLPSAEYVNVVGMVKPYGRKLVEYCQLNHVLFVLKEE